MRVAFIDDDSDLHMIAKFALEKIGNFTVAYYFSGPEAVQSIGTFLPDIILLDYVLPEWSGAVTFAKLREISAISTTPIVFLTAKNSPSDLANFKTLGAVGSIAKPINPKTLAEEVRKFLPAQ